MSVANVNVLCVELDEPLDEAGFRHVAVSLGDRLGARRIGASVYRAQAGVPIWPYHYHHGIEEWLYVIAGAPVLREPAGERSLAPGDLVCFPSGHRGAHTIKGPGRFVIFATGQHVEPWMSVYPDSDKVSGPGGILLRSSAVGYWHGEGTAGPSQPDEIGREPKHPSPRPIVHAPVLPGQTTEPQRSTGSGNPTAGLGAVPDGDRLRVTVAELHPREESDGYHYAYGREKWVLVLAGALTLRHAQAEEHLGAGDLVCVPEGPPGAHQLLNRSDTIARLIVLTTTGFPVNICYPDTGRWEIHNGPGRDDIVVASADRNERSQR